MVVGFLSVMLGLVALVLIGVVLIQDSKAGGLSAAFGGGGGESLLGASSQKDITRFTTITAIIFLGLCTLVGILSKDETDASQIKSGNTQIQAPVEPGSDPIGSSIILPGGAGGDGAVGTTPPTGTGDPKPAGSTTGGTTGGDSGGTPDEGGGG